MTSKFREVVLFASAAMLWTFVFSYLEGCAVAA